MLYESYDENTAGELFRRLINSIKSSDPAKFERGIRKVNSTMKLTDFKIDENVNTHQHI